MVAYPLPAYSRAFVRLFLNREGYAASSLFPHFFVIAPYQQLLHIAKEQAYDLSALQKTPQKE
jgi:hypothetical protein